MRKLQGYISAIGVVMGLSVLEAAPSSPAASATQTVNMTIVSASNLTTSGNPGTLSVTLNAAGTGNASDSSTTYTVTSNTNATGRYAIAGQISSGGDMPANTSLTVNLASKAGVSAGAQSLNSKGAVNLVTGLPTLVSDTQAITYTFTVQNGWTVPAQSLAKTITLTLVSAS